MNQKQLKQLEANLWDSADNLRANSKLTAAEYKDPVLGLILLRYAQNRYQQAKQIVEDNIPQSPRGGKRAATKADFKAVGAMMLPEHSQYDYLANLPEGDNINDAVNTAMKLIEEDYPELAGILPRNYQDLSEDLLSDLVRVFNKDSVKNLTGDVFGRIYEYFLMKFSMTGAGAQEGGEFFTPPSLVQLIVNLIQPDHGVIHDPACGSGGMFVQTGHFIENQGTGKSVNEAITCYGTELKSNNAKLAKMNLAIHGIEGKVIESNSFYTNPHELVGQCDFVMANPPFNVNKVDKKSDYVKTDNRLFADVGIPKADNGNYLWIQYFYHYLNEQGRAGFVMASSATDAGNSEKAIRQRLIETGGVDCIVAVGNNFFYTRSLPCHVWFLDKGKRTENKHKILMIDARNTSRKVNTTLSDFSTGQLGNFSAIMQAYRGDTLAIANARKALQKQSHQQAQELIAGVNALCKQSQKIIKDHALDSLDFTTTEASTTQVLQCAEAGDYADYETLVTQFEQPTAALTGLVEQYQTTLDVDKKAMLAAEKKTKKKDTAQRKQLDAKAKLLRELSAVFKAYQDQFTQSSVGEPLQDYKQSLKDWHDLQSHFPDDQYRDIEGLCKVVDLEEVKENDYSLTPGRYVGYSIQIDMDFDYQGRMAEIHRELAGLNDKANGLMG
ncbi:MAG: class I SAM-dependent DNA methyltransferase, partial [Methyloprofundus sp.]|nr:class I SAM-dependent DNA methyltransferase [Methyloprofundus sp.]